MEYLDGPTEEQIARSKQIRVLVQMADSDEQQAKAGMVPYAYEDPKIQDQAQAMSEAFKRAKSGVPLFQRFFHETLTAYDRHILGLD